MPGGWQLEQLPSPPFDFRDNALLRETPTPSTVPQEQNNLATTSVPKKAGMPDLCDVVRAFLLL